MKLMLDMCHVAYDTSIMVWSMRLLEGFRSSNHIDDISIVCFSESMERIKNIFPDFRIIPFERKGFIGKYRLASVRAALTWRRISKTYRPDVILAPMPTTDLVLVKNKTITVFHDLKDIDKRICSSIRRYKYRLTYLIALLTVDKIITISDFVKREILKKYPFVSKERIATVYNSIDLKLNCHPTSGRRGKYILYVSTLLEYKNLLTLLKAFNTIKSRISQNLVIIGRETPYWRNVLNPYIIENHLEDRIVHITDRISDEKLAQYYSEADLLVHPSLHEGFGYTPIEAALFETPVLTNKCTAIYETTMGLLNYYDPPVDSDALAQGIISVLKNPPSPERLHSISETFKRRYDCAIQAENMMKISRSLFSTTLYVNR